MAVASIIQNVVFILNDCPKAEMRLRRDLSFLTYPICTVFFCSVFGVVKNVNAFLLSSAIMLVPEKVFLVVLTVIVEDIQKKNLTKINRKLKENISKTDENK